MVWYRAVLNYKEVHRFLASNRLEAKGYARSYLIAIGYNKHFLAGLTVSEVN